MLVAVVTTYLNDEIFESLSILGRLARVALLQLLHGKKSKFLNTLIAPLHLIEADFVAGLRCSLTMLSAHLLHLLFMVFLGFAQLLLEQPLSVLLTLPLAFEHDLKSTLVSVLPHHALELERVCVEIHHPICCWIILRIFII